MKSEETLFDIWMESFKLHNWIESKKFKCKNYERINRQYQVMNRQLTIIEYHLYCDEIFNINNNLTDLYLRKINFN